MSQRLDHAKQIAREAGELTLRYFHSTSLQVQRKGDDSPVTEADRGAELLLRRRIEEHFPDDAILGEEFPSKEGTSGYRWILDPIDGTKSFIHGVPLYSTLIGLEYAGESKLGVIAFPALVETIWAEQGTGAWFETPRTAGPVPARVSATEKLAESLFLVSEIRTFDDVDRRDFYTELEREVRLSRTWGDAYGYYLVATGRAEIMVDPIMGLWDAGPLLVILEEAGGMFTDWNGNRTILGEEGIGTNGILHEKILESARRFPKTKRENDE